MTDLNDWLAATVIWFGNTNYSLMQWIDNFWWPGWGILVLFAMTIGMAPLKTHFEQKFYEYVLVYIRRSILVLAACFLTFPFVTYLIYLATAQYSMDYNSATYSHWFKKLAEEQWWVIIPAFIVGGIYQFLRTRYFVSLLSRLKKKLRFQVTQDTPTDIRDESAKYEEKNYVPEKYYKDDSIFMSLDENDQPIYVPNSTWYETNMQVIGPTRYGKGVIMGPIMEQAILRGDCLFYIDPKKDKFGPRIMQQACKKAGRKFYYLALHDDGFGRWAPFAGGDEDSGLTRLEKAFGLEFTGDPGTDYYKSQERKDLVGAFAQSRYLDKLYEMTEDNTESRINAELSRWRKVQSLRVTSKQKGFSIAKALKENAVVYVQGHLNNDVVKTATNVFIIELIQEAMRLEKERKAHLTAIIDEVSFLVSKDLAQALATAVGFRVNFVLAYQSQNDLLNLDDKNVNAKYVHNSINVNSQIKAVYGGADEFTAEWLAGLSGTITKNVTKMERTEFSSAGGEEWQNQRTVGPQEENYINTNTILTLPPRVCVFIQPRHLASVAFSSFVPVKDMEALDKHLASIENNQKAGVESQKKIRKEPTNDLSLTKKPEKNQFIEDKIKVETPNKTKNSTNQFIEDQSNKTDTAKKPKIKASSTKKKTTPQRSKTAKNVDLNPKIESPAPNKLSLSKGNIDLNAAKFKTDNETMTLLEGLDE